MYFALAAFDVLVVTVSVYTNHRLTSSYEQAVEQNREWARHLSDLSELRALAGAVNAPGNDVFDSHDVDGEVHRGMAAKEEFDRTLATILASYAGRPPAERDILVNKLGDVGQAADQMTEEADRIFNLYRAGHAQLAGQRMATMNRAYVVVNRTLAEVERAVRDFHGAQLAVEAAHLARLRTVETLLAVAILLMVAGALVYGHQVATAARRSIDEREFYLAELAVNEARTRAVLHSVLEGIFTFDQDLVVRSANPALAKLVRRDSVIGLTATEFLPDLDLDEVLAWAGAQARACALRLPNGDVREVDLAIAEIPAEGGPLFSAVLRDVTASRQLAASLEAARQSAEEASVAKSAFLANMSHELRTPLNAIIGYSELLQETLEVRDPEVTAHVASIHSAGQHLLGLISDVLDLSKIEAGKATLHIEQVDVAEIVADLRSTTEVLAARRSNTFVVTVDADLPPVRTDPLKLRQVLLNLLSNACKFTEQGTITLNATRRGRSVALEVGDTGIGMSEEQLGKLFVPFSQADASTTRRYGGTGLGLAISKRLTELLGGTLQVTSAVGEGSRFVCTLPPRPPEGNTLSTTGPTEGRSDEIVRQLTKLGLPDGGALGLLRREPGITVIAVAPLEGVRGVEFGPNDYIVKPVDGNALARALQRILGDAGRGRVLVVDDDVDARRLMTLRLRAMGHDVDEAHNGRHALERIAIQRPDLLLLDLTMPEVDGFAVIAALAADESLRTIPVIVVTARDLADEDVARLNDAVAGLVHKPAQVSEVLDSVSELVHAHLPS